jgi:hypothetical protein
MSLVVTALVVGATIVAVLNLGTAVGLLIRGRGGRDMVQWRGRPTPAPGLLVIMHLCIAGAFTLMAIGNSVVRPDSAEEIVVLTLGLGLLVVGALISLLMWQHRGGVEPRG